ncbi:hypothetical protein M378DRAFT_183429 [Amanita muscaria Koide BX008]|uniref:EamA domain-containing protein n=1 Tax=Amanita muscaria (strain Koide BX008) TaxID=946122 RepID=A0A0C2XMQ5_AMAMK|nr:hypothetical protein M378DRAFT_183429 [Amanita muscaria Koide BX008]
MSSRQESARLGGKFAVLLFIATLLAFVTESQFTQYVQTTLGYRQPFFIFYIVHSSFSLIFPLHLLFLRITSGHKISSLLKGLSLAIKDHLASSDTAFPLSSLIRLSLLLFVGLTCPALLWFASVSLASLSDVTAIWNTNAFFAYVFTVKLFHLSWDARRLVAVTLATLGVMIVVYGGSTQPDLSQTKTTTTVKLKPTAPLVGDILTLFASVGYGLYQVLYKKYAALPSDPDLVAEAPYQPISEDGESESLTENRKGSNAVYPPPFGLHSNLLISFVGVLTLFILWIFLPVLHHFGTERFRLPENRTTVFAICGIAVSGIVFNAGLMVLLGIWGPIIVSVGNLLTIVLVALSDVFFGAGIENFTTWSLMGCSIITIAFGVLVYDMVKKGSGIS